MRVGLGRVVEYYLVALPSVRDKSAFVTLVVEGGRAQIVHSEPRFREN